MLQHHVLLGWGNGAISKVLISETSGCYSDSSHTYQNSGHDSAHVYSLRYMYSLRQSHEYRWGLLSTQLNLTYELQAKERHVSEDICGIS